MYIGPKITTDGLILHLDAANTKSYPGTGTVWTDLSGNGNNGTLTNGPTLDNSNYGNIVFDGINDYVVINNNPVNNDLNAWTVDGSLGTTTMTLEILVKTTDSAGYIISKPWNSSGQYNFRATPTQFFLWCGPTGTTQIATINFLNSINDGNWRHLILWANTTQIGYYLDGGKYTDSITHGLTGSIPSVGNSRLPLGIMTLYFYGEGWAGVTNFSMQGNVGFFRKYNRVLSVSEMQQNYNATKSRYNL